jgi:ribosome-associated heat shock protein Hsp15
MAGASVAMTQEAAGGGAIRLDKWLWHARFCKSRSLAATLVAEGRVRVNSERVTKPARSIGAGDVLTFPQGTRIRVIRVIAPGDRRGPAVEAQALYEDLDPAATDTPIPESDASSALE